MTDDTEPTEGPPAAEAGTPAEPADATTGATPSPSSLGAWLRRWLRPPSRPWAGRPPRPPRPCGLSLPSTKPPPRGVPSSSRCRCGAGIGAGGGGQRRPPRPRRAPRRRLGTPTRPTPVAHPAPSRPAPSRQRHPHRRSSCRRPPVPHPRVRGNRRSWVGVAVVAALIGAGVGAGVTALADNGNNDSVTIHEGTSDPGAAVLSGNVTIPGWSRK